MPFRVSNNIIKRKIKEITFRENAQDTVDLNRGFDIMGVTVRLTGTVTLSVAATSVKTLAPAQAILQLEMLSDGAIAIEETNGLLAAFARFERGMRRVIIAPGTTAIAHTIEAEFYMDRANLDGIRPKDSAMHTARPFMSLLQLRITTGSLANMFVGGTISGFALTLEVFQEEIQEFDERNMVEAKFVRRASFQTHNIGANNTDFPIKLPTGAFIRGVKIIALDDLLQPVDTVVTNIILKERANVRINTPFKKLRNDNFADYRIAQGDSIAGIAFADMTPDGSVRRLFDARRASDMELTLNVTKPGGGDGTVHVGVIEMIEQGGA